MIEPKELADRIAKQLDEKKASDVAIINISQKASFADYFVLASGGSDRQMGALVEVVEDLLEPEGIFPKNIEGKKTSGWI
ncbi:MAG: ribosome silencing factor [Anaerovoracaceae bacterium]